MIGVYVVIARVQAFMYGFRTRSSGRRGRQRQSAARVADAGRRSALSNFFIAHCAFEIGILASVGAAAAAACPGACIMAGNSYGYSAGVVYLSKYSRSACEAVYFGPVAFYAA